MDVDASLAVGVLGNHAGQHLDTEAVEEVGDAVVGDCPDGGVAVDDLGGRQGGGVAAIDGFEVEVESLAQLGEGGDEPRGGFLGVVGPGGVVAGLGAGSDVVAGANLARKKVMELGHMQTYAETE